MRIVALLGSFAVSTMEQIYHKTGELDGVRHDCGIVAWDENAFALTLLTADGGAPWEVDRAMADLSRACFDFLDSNRL